MKRLLFSTIAVLSVCAACIDTGQEGAAVALWARGTPAAEPISGKSDWRIELGRADVAFGPLYVCAGTQAGALCDTAQLEWLESVVVDGLDAEAREIGTLGGVTGRVQSWMCDLGITSLLTQPQPRALEAAEQLGGHSVVLQGVATKAPHTVSFLVEIPIELEPGAEVGVSVLAKGSSEPFDHEVASSGDALTVRFDPAPWAAAIDFDGLVRGQDCEADGCDLEVTLGLDTPAGVAVRTAVLAGKRPSFVWSDAR